MYTFYVQAPQIIRPSQELRDDQLKLKRVSDLITAYESIAEKNYIDNLVWGQKWCDKTVDNAILYK